MKKIQDAEKSSYIAGLEQTISEQAIEIHQANNYIDQLKKVIQGMFPLWISAMGYGEHGRAAELDRIRNYYRGKGNPMTNEDIHLMFSVISEKGN